MNIRLCISCAVLAAVSITCRATEDNRTPRTSIPFFRILTEEEARIKSSNFVIPEELYSTRTVRAKSDWLYLVYMAADNNLSYFAWHNIKQMSAVGSNANITIVVQLNEPGAAKKTQRYLIEKNQAVLLNQEQVAAGKKFNTGDPQTLIDFCTESIQKFPSNHIALVLWDHGTGYLDPLKVKVINPQELFQLNPNDMMLELNRIDRETEQFEDNGMLRGICFDETYHTYLSNQKVDYALRTICTKIQRKFDIIGLDACLMQMLEFGCLLAPYTDYMVGSQEVELGAGWNYKHVFAPFADHSFEPADFANHIVDCYQKAYSKITHDYTLSAAHLSTLLNLAGNVNTTAQLLQQCLQLQQGSTVKDTLTDCRAKKNCVCFDEPSYIDLGNFYKNLLTRLSNFKLQSNMQLIEQLRKNLETGLTLLQKTIIANVTGKNLTRACGLSIYCPEKRLHLSYPKTPFAATNNWGTFIQLFTRA